MRTELNGSAKHALVTGAAGFVGSHLVDRLIAEGFDVVGIDNFVTGRVENIRHLDGHPRFTFIEHDACEAPPVIGPVDWIAHLASPASPPRYLERPIETMRVNGEGTRLMLDLALKTGARFLLASTSEVYGDPLVHPQPEEYWGCVNPIGPRSVYDEAKRYAEAMTMAYHRCHRVSTRIMRVFNTYGPRMAPGDGRVVTNYITQALAGEPLTVYGDGTQTRSFQYVDDLVSGILALMKVEHHQPINLGNPVEFTMLELAEVVKEVTGSDVPIVFRPLPQDDPRQRQPVITKAKQILGWQPSVALRDGVMRTVAYLRSCQSSPPIAPLHRQSTPSRPSRRTFTTTTGH
jgi:nucleoside-diphosphate-sugar epimerase